MTCMLTKCLMAMERMIEMTNLLVYKKVLQLKDYLELHDSDSVSQAKLNHCIEYLNRIFEKLERRSR